MADQWEYKVTGKVRRENLELMGKEGWELTGISPSHRVQHTNASTTDSGETWYWKRKI